MTLTTIFIGLALFIYPVLFLVLRFYSPVPALIRDVSARSVWKLGPLLIAGGATYVALLTIAMITRGFIASLSLILSAMLFIATWIHLRRLWGLWRATPSQQRSALQHYLWLLVVSFALVAPLALVTGSVLGGRAAADSLARLQLVWPSVLDMPTEDRAVLVRLALICHLPSAPMEKHAVLACLRDASLTRPSELDRFEALAASIRSPET